LKGEPSEDLERKLRDVGYSEDVVREILKWYKKNNDRKT